MPRSAVSLRKEQMQFGRLLREQHQTWAEVAGEFRERYGINARVAFRLARGWSQRQAADEWNKRWPADPKTFKNISYWEVWPASTGHAPSLDVLTKLAEELEQKGSAAQRRIGSPRPCGYRVRNFFCTHFMNPFDEGRQSARRLVCFCALKFM